MGCGVPRASGSILRHEPRACSQHDNGSGGHDTESCPVTLFVRTLKRYFVACADCDTWASKEFDDDEEAYADAEDRGFRLVQLRDEKPRHVCHQCAVTYP